jgi:small acid-soluble spore protein E (minor gamma-type SASP)
MKMDKLTDVEVIPMAKNKKTEAGTNIGKVKQQNQMASQGNYEAEFADETVAQDVKQKNQKSEQSKK